MHRLRGFMFTAACLLLLSACGGKDPETVEQGSVVKKARTPEEVVWSFAPKAVRLNIKATPDLNTEGGQSHTVLLCLYQLTKPDGFNALSATAEGLDKLLQCGAFDDSVVAFERMIVAPGQVTGLVYDRVEKARNTALAAGYANLSPKLVTRTWAMPIIRETSGMLWWSETWYYAAPLDMAVLLGPQGIQQLGGAE